jgi:hypothetical protein
MSFHIGQRVVCVSTNFSREPYWRRTVRMFPQLNGIYTIRSMRTVDDLVGLCFEEMINPCANFKEGYVEAAFDSRRFRPVRTTNIDVFKALLVPRPAAARRPREYAGSNR